MDNYYVIILLGDQEIVELLKKHLTTTTNTLSEARTIRAAAYALFGDAVEVDIKGRTERDL